MHLQGTGRQWQREEQRPWETRSRLQNYCILRPLLESNSGTRLWTVREESFHSSCPKENTTKSSLFLSEGFCDTMMESAVIKQEKADHVNQAIISIDKDGTMAACNNAARHMFGFPIGKMIGTNVSALMPAPFDALHASYVERYLRTRISHGDLPGDTTGDITTSIREKPGNRGVGRFARKDVGRRSVIGHCPPVIQETRQLRNFQLAVALCIFLLSRRISHWCALTVVLTDAAANFVV